MKKSLLSESEIRKFMKFANIGTLTESFIENNTALEEEVVEEATEELEEGYHDPAGRDDDMAEAAHGDMDEGAHEETLEEKMDADEQAEFIQDLVNVIMDHTGGKIEVVSGEEGADDDMDMDAPPMDAPPMDEPIGDEPDSGEMEMAPEDEEDMAGLVNEVTKRVAARLLRANKS